MTQLQDRTVIIQEPGRSSGGMGFGIILGVILVLILGFGVVWFAVGGNRPGPSTTAPAAGSSTDVTIQTPEIKVPDNITVNTNPPQ